MSGHSKWATIKHKKGAADKARGKLWAKLVRNIEVAAREGGGDKDGNATLRTMITKAKAEQVPADKIENAIKRGTGELKADLTMEDIMYEGYAPAGVALLVQVSTDNRNRSSSDVRTAFSKNGGNIAEPGAVAWQFARRGVVTVPKVHAGRTVTEDDLMLTAVDAGAEDIIDNGDAFELRCGPTDIGAVCHVLAEAGIHFDSADRPMVANTVISVTSEADARKILKMIDALEDLDDVEEVFSNFDISEDLFAALSA
jgi:YebC/PmpR family DNA-binding regulatory protein